MQQLTPNTFLQGGKYKIVRFIASGGFGCTYEAQHIMLGKRVAIKEFFMKDSCNRDETTNRVIVAIKAKEEQVARMKNKFMKEACALQNMSHPNIVHVENAFEENATAYYVMDYIEGTSLNDIIKVAGSLSETKALNYIIQIADALKYVHSKNILHLDIKPGNIMVDKNGKAILIDFGASKQYDEVTGENTSTLLGINTTGYAPAEQSYKGFVQFAASTDIYALGATLYKLLTGITPPDAQMLKDGEVELTPLPSNISASVKNAITESMRPLRKDRPQSIDEFLKYLGTSYASVISAPASPKTVDERTLVYDSTKSSWKESISDNIYVEVQTEAETDPREIYYKALGFHDNKNYKEAFPLFMQSANLGDGDALYQIGEYYSLGLISAKNKIEAFKWYKKAAEEGFCREAIQKLGWCYLCGVGVEQDETKALEWYAKAAEKGMHEAAIILKQIRNKDLNVLFLKAKSSYGYNKFGLLTYIAKLGHVGAQYELGECYSETFGAFKDEKKAFEWYTKAAEQGHSEAQYELARCYRLGHGISENPKKALEWYTKAAEQGHPKAQDELGYWYELGLCGLKQDINKAIELYSKAAERGNQDATRKIKALYKQLREGPYARALQLYQNKKYYKAIKVLEKVANQGLPEAQYLLGEFYVLGRGVPKDESKAFELYTKAAKQGNKDAKDMLAKINGNQSLASASQKSESSHKDDLQNKANKPKENTDTKMSHQQRKEQPVNSSKEKKETNPIIEFMKKVFS